MGTHFPVNPLGSNSETNSMSIMQEAMTLWEGNRRMDLCSCHICSTRSTKATTLTWGPLKKKMTNSRSHMLLTTSRNDGGPTFLAFVLAEPMHSLCTSSLAKSRTGGLWKKTLLIFFIRRHSLQLLSIHCVVSI